MHVETVICVGSSVHVKPERCGITPPCGDAYSLTCATSANLHELRSPGDLWLLNTTTSMLAFLKQQFVNRSTTAFFQRLLPSTNSATCHNRPDHLMGRKEIFWSTQFVKVAFTMAGRKRRNSGSVAAVSCRPYSALASYVGDDFGRLAQWPRHSRIETLAKQPDDRLANVCSCCGFTGNSALPGIVELCYICSGL